MNSELVVFYSSKGATLETVEKIKNLRKADVDYLDLQKENNIDIEKYKRVFIGSGVYAGSVHESVKKFVDKNIDQLKNKEVVFFVHGLASKPVYETIIEKIVNDNELMSKSKIFYLGGKLDYEKQNFFMKQIMKLIAKKENLDIRKMDNIDKDKVQELLDMFK